MYTLPKYYKASTIGQHVHVNYAATIIIGNNTNRTIEYCRLRPGARFVAVVCDNKVKQRGAPQRIRWKFVTTPRDHPSAASLITSLTKVCMPAVNVPPPKKKCPTYCMPS